MEKLNKMHEDLNTMFAQFNKDHIATVAGNKAAARRNRVLSVKIRKLLTENKALSSAELL